MRGVVAACMGLQESMIAIAALIVYAQHGYKLFLCNSVYIPGTLYSCV